MRKEAQIDYIEIPVTDLGKARAFFEELFGFVVVGLGETKQMP